MSSLFSQGRCRYPTKQELMWYKFCPAVANPQNV